MVPDLQDSQYVLTAKIGSVCCIKKPDEEPFLDQQNNSKAFIIDYSS